LVFEWLKSLVGAAEGVSVDLMQFYDFNVG